MSMASARTRLFIKVPEYHNKKIKKSTSLIDCIEYDITVHISALQHGVCTRARVGVLACAVQIKPGKLRAACFIYVRVWTRIRFALQDLRLS